MCPSHHQSDCVCSTDVTLPETVTTPWHPPASGMPQVRGNTAARRIHHLSGWLVLFSHLICFFPGSRAWMAWSLLLARPTGATGVSWAPTLWPCHHKGAGLSMTRWDCLTHVAVITVRSCCPTPVSHYRNDRNLTATYQLSWTVSANSRTITVLKVF